MADRDAARELAERIDEVYTKHWRDFEDGIDEPTRTEVAALIREAAAPLVEAAEAKCRCWRAAHGFDCGRDLPNCAPIDQCDRCKALAPWRAKL